MVFEDIVCTIPSNNNNKWYTLLLALMQPTFVFRTRNVYAIKFNFALEFHRRLFCFFPLIRIFFYFISNNNNEHFLLLLYFECPSYTFYLKKVHIIYLFVYANCYDSFS